MSFKHGGNVEEISRIYNIKEEEIYDFSANINPLGMAINVKKVMFEAIEKVERYPDITYYNLKKSISDYENINYKNIVLGNGAAEVIFNISRALKPKKALLIAPTFSEYEDSLKSVDCDIDYYKLDKDFKIKEDFLESLKEDIDITFICNPNNPTGILTEKDFIIKVLEKAKEKNIVIVIDESFLDFLEDKKEYSVMNKIEEFNNLIIVKSLTKAFSFPGIRVGFGVTCNKEYIKKINKVSVSWNVNTVALYGAIQALKEVDYMKKTVEFIREENIFLFHELSAMKEIKVYKGSVNFLFFKVIKNFDLKEEMIKKGVLIRSCSNYKGLEEGYYRVAVRSRKENLKLIDTLKNVFEERKS